MLEYFVAIFLYKNRKNVHLRVTQQALDTYFYMY